MRRQLTPGAIIVVAGLSSTCILPTDQPSNLRVVVDKVVIIQRLDTGHPVRKNAESYRSQFIGTDGDTAAVACADASAFCVWQLPAPATSPQTDSLLRGRAPGQWTLRLGDRIVVKARLEGESGIVEGSRLTEVALTKVVEEGRGPASNRVQGDTLDLRSVGEVTLSVKSAGFPRAVADTLTLVVTPGWLMNPCATDQNPDCAPRTLFIGDTVSIRGGPFSTLRDPVTREVLSQLLEPQIRVYREPALIASRTDSQITVFVPPAPKNVGLRGGPAITLVSLGIPAPCVDPPGVAAPCFTGSLYPFVPWDVLEPTVRDSAIGDTVATDLGTFGGGDTLFAHPALALEDRQEALALGGNGTARDWYTFTLPSATSLLIEANSATPLLLQLTNALEWDGLQQRHVVSAGGWGVGSTLVCAGVEVGIQFQQDVFAGRRTLAIDVPAGTYHLLVSATLPLAVSAGYSLTIRDAPPPLPSDGFEDDDQCGSATPLSAVGTSNLTLDGPNDVDWFRFTTNNSLWTRVLPRIKQTGQALHAIVVRNALPDSLPVIFDLGAAVSGGPPTLPSGDYFLVVFSDGASGDYRLADVIDRVTVSPRGLDISTTDGPRRLVATARSPEGVALQGVATWQSLNPYRATIDASSGMVTAHASGQVTMAAEVGGVTGYALVTVAAPDAVPVQSWVQESDLGGVSEVWGLSPTMVWATATTGVRRHIWMYDGSNWTQQFEVARACCLFWGSSSTDVWAVSYELGTLPQIVHWDGTAWSLDSTAFPANASFLARKLWGSSPTDVWLTSSDGAIYHYDGLAWTFADSLAADVGGIWGSAVDDVWTVGGGAVLGGLSDAPVQLFRFDGSNWISRRDFNMRTVAFGKSIWGNSSTDLWTLIQSVDDSLVVSRNQGSGGWSALSVVGDGVVIRGLWGSSATSMYVLGRGGDSDLYRFDGVSWQGVTLSGVSADFVTFAIWGFSDGPVWVVGNSAGGGLVRGVRR